MASVWPEPRHKDGKRTWLVRWRSRKLREAGSEICYSAAQRDTFLDTKRQELRDRELGNKPAVGTTPWSEFVDTYLKTRIRKAPSTQELDRAALSLFGTFIKGKDLQHVTSSTLDAFHDWLLSHEYRKDRRYHQNSIGIRLRHLRVALRWAHRRGKITQNPFANFDMPPSVEVRRYVDPEAVKSLLASLPDLSRRGLIFVLYTGLRSGELLSLDWKMVRKDGDKFIATVPKSKVRRAEATKEVQTKTLALHPAVLAVMGPPHKSGPIFPGMTKNMIQQAMRRARAKLKLGRIRWHDIRHTWGTDLMQVVKDEYALMAVGGWKSRAAVAIYQHATPVRRDSPLMLPTRDTTEAAKEEPGKSDSST